MLGGALGAGLRYQISAAMLRLTGPGFPWGTWSVNLLGGLLMGMLAAFVTRQTNGEHLRIFLGTGVLGGFTTFSAFSLETFNMLARGQHFLAAAYAVSSVVGAVLMLVAGVYLCRAFL
jgi:CrcB protein